MEKRLGSCTVNVAWHSKEPNQRSPGEPVIDSLLGSSQNGQETREEENDQMCSLSR